MASVFEYLNQFYSTPSSVWIVCYGRSLLDYPRYKYQDQTVPSSVFIIGDYETDN